MEEGVGTWGMQNCTTDEQAPIDMSACQHFRGLYMEDKSRGRCRHVGTWRMKNCTTDEQAPVGMSALQRSIYVRQEWGKM